MTLATEHYELDLPLHYFVSTNKEGTLGLVWGYDSVGVLMVRAFRIAANYAVTFGPYDASVPGTGNADYNLSPESTVNHWVYPNVAVVPFYRAAEDSYYTMVVKISDDDLGLSFQDQMPWEDNVGVYPHYGGGEVLFGLADGQLFTGFITTTGTMPDAPVYHSTLPESGVNAGLARVDDDTFWYPTSTTSGIFLTVSTATTSSAVSYELPSRGFPDNGLTVGGLWDWPAAGRFMALASYFAEAIITIVYEYDPGTNSVVIVDQYEDPDYRSTGLFSWGLLLGDGKAVFVESAYRLDTTDIHVVFDPFGSVQSFTVTPPTNGISPVDLPRRARNKGFLIVTDSYDDTEGYIGPSYMTVVHPTATTGLPPLRQLQRGDGLGIGGVPRALQRSSVQSSLRTGNPFT